MTISGMVGADVIRVTSAPTSKTSTEFQTDFSLSYVSRGCLITSSGRAEADAITGVCLSHFFCSAGFVSQFLAVGSGLLTANTMRQPALPNQRQKCA